MTEFITIEQYCLEKKLPYSRVEYIRNRIEKNPPSLRFVSRDSFDESFLDEVNSKFLQK
jgi:hypothetical protein